MVLMFPRYDRGVTNFKIHPLKKMAGHWGKKKNFLGKRKKWKPLIYWLKIMHHLNEIKDRQNITPEIKLSSTHVTLHETFVSR